MGPRRVTGPRGSALVVLGLLVVGLLMPWAAVTASAQDSPGGTVTVEPQKVAPGGTLTLSGWCARVLRPDGSLGPPPASTAVLLDAIPLTTVPVDQTSGTWGPVYATVPPGTTAGDHALRTGCGGGGTFTVLAPPAAPALAVTPNRARLPVTVTVGGTCPPGTTSVRLLLDGSPAGPLDLNQATGEIQPITLELRIDTPTGDHLFRTSCGGTATFTALAAPEPTTGTTAPAPSRTTAPSTSSTAMVRVPDLVGLTEQAAVRALGSSLHLARITGNDGHIRSQQPVAGTLLPEGSAVTVTFEPATGPASANSLLWALVGAGGALLLVAAAWALFHLRGGGRPPRGPGRGGMPPNGPVPRPHAPPETLVGGPPGAAPSDGGRLPTAPHGGA